jgi:hypothetical protein
MEKETGSIKFIETDDGYRVEVKGKSLKEAMSCCGPMFGGGTARIFACCLPADCCSPEGKKKE